MEKISFIILTWNSEKTIENCLRSIAHLCESQGTDYEIIVVDNGSTDQTPAIVDSLVREIRLDLICLDRNLGTTRTRNLAIRKSDGTVLCVMDSDAALLDVGLPDIVATLRQDPSIGILAPKLLFSNGEVQPSVRKFPSLFGKFSRVPAIVFKRRLPDTDLYEDFPFPYPTDVDYAISACWFFRRELLDSVGYLDERIFYSPEDVDYCIRTWRKGYRVVFDPRFTVLHHVQQITHKNFLGRIALSHLCGLVYYFMKHRYISSPRITGTQTTLRSSGSY